MKFTTVAKDYADVTTLSDDDYICYCTEVDKKTIVNAINSGATTLKAIKERKEQRILPKKTANCRTPVWHHKTPVGF